MCGFIAGSEVVNVAAGTVAINGGSTVYGILRAPSSLVVFNGNSRLRGALFADRLILNGGAVIEELPIPTPGQAPALVGQQTAPTAVLPGQAFEHTLTLSNTASVSATEVLVRERFVGTIPVSATFTQTAPTVPARQAAESPAVYQSRLAAADRQVLRADGTITYADASGPGYAPLHAASATELRLPQLVLGLAAPECVGPGSTITYRLRVSNIGSAVAANATAQLTLPDGSTQDVAIGAIAAGATTTATAE